MNYDARQLEAVTTVHPRVMCVAGAGSGKTSVVKGRIEYMLDALHLNPAELVVITFTRCGAHEIKERVGNKAQGAFIGTLHSFVLKLLMERGDHLGYVREWLTIIDEKEAELDEREVLNDLGLISKKKGGKWDWKRIKASEWSDFKNNITNGSLSPEEAEKNHPSAWKAWQHLLNRFRAQNVLTFGTIMYEGYRLLDDADTLAHYRLHHRHFIVDECVRGDTKIAMSDGTQVAIRDIVENRMQGSVLAFDEKEQRVVSRPIIGWHVAYRRGRRFIRLRDAVVTEDHSVLTNYGWKDACMATRYMVCVLNYDELRPIDAYGKTTAHHSWQSVGRCVSDYDEESMPTVVPPLSCATALPQMEVQRAKEPSGNSATRTDRNGVRFFGVFISNHVSRFFQQLYSFVSTKPRAEENNTRRYGGTKSSLFGRVVHGRRLAIRANGKHFNARISRRGPFDSGSTTRSNGVSGQTSIHKERHPLDIFSKEHARTDKDCSSAYAPVFRVQTGRQHEEASAPHICSDIGSEKTMRGLREAIRSDKKRHNVRSEMRERKAFVEGEKRSGKETEENAEEVVYCIDVEGTHNFFAGGVCVHNCQDTDHHQWRIVLKFMEKSEASSIFVVGDGDQSVYQWRGAAPEIMMTLAKDERTNVIMLENCYRFGKGVAQPALNLIRHNVDRIDKGINPRGEHPGSCVTHRDWTIQQTAEHIASQVGEDNSDTAVLCRTHAPLEELAKALKSRGVKCKKLGKLAELQATSEFRAVMGYLRLAVNPSDRGAFMAITATEGLSEAEILEVRQLAVSGGESLLSAYGEALPTNLTDIAERISRTDAYGDYIEAVNYLYLFCEREGVFTPDDIVRSIGLSSVQDEMRQVDRDTLVLCTIHAAKGLEWPHVYVIGMNEGLFPSCRSVMDGRIEEERRLCYVAITRAKQSVTLIHNDFSEVKRQFTLKGLDEPSQFMEEISDVG